MTLLSIRILFLKCHHCSPLITCMWISNPSLRWEEMFNSLAVKSTEVAVTGMQMLSLLLPLPLLIPSEGWSPWASPGQRRLCSPGSSTGFPSSLPSPTGMEQSPREEHAHTQLGAGTFPCYSIPSKAICSWQSCNSVCPSLHQAAAAPLCAATEPSQLRFQSRVTTRMPVLWMGPGLNRLRWKVWHNPSPCLTQAVHTHLSEGTGKSCLIPAK